MQLNPFPQPTPGVPKTPVQLYGDWSHYLVAFDIEGRFGFPSEDVCSTKELQATICWVFAQRWPHIRVVFRPSYAVNGPDAQAVLMIHQWISRQYPGEHDDDAYTLQHPTNPEEVNLPI